MRRVVQQVAVITGWLIFYACIIIVITPAVLAFQEPALQRLPLENIIPAAIMTLVVGVPIIYSIGSFVLLPLLMATLEVFDREH